MKNSIAYGKESAEIVKHEMAIAINRGNSKCHSMFKAWGESLYFSIERMTSETSEFKKKANESHKVYCERLIKAIEGWK